MAGVQERYKPGVLSDRYDAIVIGAGIGGLIAANFLAWAGVKTLLVERHYLLGGYMQGGRHKGFYFDYGTQSSGVRGTILPCLEQLGLSERIHFHKCQYRFVATDGLDVNLDSMEGTERTFLDAYPESASELRQYFSYYRRVREVARGLNEDAMAELIRTDSARFMPDYDSFWREQPYYDEMMAYEATPSWRKAREILGTGTRAARVLTHLGYRNQSALATGLFWHYWLDDYYYNDGGKQELCDMLADAFMERGGTVSIQTQVEQILVEDGEATGVRLANGRLIRAGAVISNADMRATMEGLLGGQEAVRPWIEQMKATPTSEAMFSVYLGLSIPREQLAEYLKGAHHVWVFPHHKPKANPFDIGFHGALPMEISAPCIADGSLTKEGHSAVVLQTFSHHEWKSRWNVEMDGRRAGAYRGLKATVEDQLVETLSQIIPDVRQKIVFRMSATPITHVRYTLNSEGATAGWTWNPRRSFCTLTDQRITTPIRNLYCAGHWALFPGGVTTATVAGKIAADLVVAQSRAGRENLEPSGTEGRLVLSNQSRS